MSYRRLFRSRFFCHEEILTEEDHLLVVTGAYQDRFRRFYFSDITALLIVPSRKRPIFLALVFTCFLITFFTVLNYAFVDTFPLQGVAISAGIWTLLGAVGYYNLPRSAIFLQTRVQQILLKSIKHKRSEITFKEFLREKIGDSQGEVAREELVEAIEKQMAKRVDKSTPPPLPKSDLPSAPSVR